MVLPAAGLFGKKEATMGILGSLFNIVVNSNGQGGSSRNEENSGVQAKPQPGGYPPKQRFFCKYCGVSYRSLRDLTRNICQQQAGISATNRCCRKRP
jgi:hypothetical protein